MCAATTATCRTPASAPKPVHVPSYNIPIARPPIARPPQHVPSRQSTFLIACPASTFTPSGPLIFTSRPLKHVPSQHVHDMSLAHVPRYHVPRGTSHTRLLSASPYITSPHDTFRRVARPRTAGPPSLHDRRTRRFTACIRRRRNRSDK